MASHRRLRAFVQQTRATFIRGSARFDSTQLPRNVSERHAACFEPSIHAKSTSRAFVLTRLHLPKSLEVSSQTTTHAEKKKTPRYRTLRDQSIKLPGTVSSLRFQMIQRFSVPHSYDVCPLECSSQGSWSRSSCS